MQIEPEAGDAGRRERAAQAGSVLHLERSRREQRALTLSMYGVALVAAGSIAYGLYLASDVVILNGIFSLLSLFGGGLSLLAAKLVARPEDSRFPYGYSHVEPLVQSVNGVEGIRGGGRTVDAHGVMWFGIVSAAVRLGFWAYESSLARRLDSGLLRNDAQEWLVDFGSRLRERIWAAAGLSIEKAWVSICLTADPRWV